MNSKETSAEVDNAAAEWVARAALSPLDGIDQTEFEEWLSKDARNHGAYLRAEAMLSAGADLLANSPEIAKPISGMQTPASRMSRRQFGVLGGSAAAAAVAGGAWLMSSMRHEEPFNTYRTAKGEVRLLPMADGSVATLNTESEISVRYSKTKREVLLARGEVLFAVAKDASRPFTVDTGNTVIRAVGTSFVVRNLKNEPTQVLVDEGAVDMFRKSSSQTPPLRVPENARAVALEVPSPLVKMVDQGMDPAVVARRLSWRHGMLSFEAQPLRNVVAEFARYSDVHIVIDDPEIGELAVTGLFSAYNPAVFAHAVAASLNLKVTETSTSVMIWRQ